MVPGLWQTVSIKHLQQETAGNLLWCPTHRPWRISVSLGPAGCVWNVPRRILQLSILFHYFLSYIGSHSFLVSQELCRPSALRWIQGEKRWRPGVMPWGDLIGLRVLSPLNCWVMDYQSQMRTQPVTENQIGHGRKKRPLILIPVTWDPCKICPLVRGQWWGGTEQC
jgi:hypothetical protein